MTSLCAQGEIVEVGPALVQGQVERVVGVVIKVGAGRDDPVDEAGLDQGDQAAHPQAGGRQRARERQADGAVGLEELVGEDRADLAQPAGVVAREGAVDQVGDRLVAGHFRRGDAMQADALEVAHGRSLLEASCRRVVVRGRLSQVKRAESPRPRPWTTGRPCGRRRSG